MREIKFRVWDDIKKEMIKYDHFISIEDGNVYRMDGAVECEVINCYPKLIPLQYTGYKDKKGKEIYEGDICKIVDEEGYSGIVEIIWEEDRFTGKNEIRDKEMGFKSRMALWSFAQNGHIEILGNSYENPELLKEGKDDQKTDDRR